MPTDPTPQPTGEDAELVARVQKRAPVQDRSGLITSIPWEMHLRAYAVYCKKWGPQKALVEGGCRGGFGVGELDDFIPGWRDELPELETAAKAVVRLTSELAALSTELEELRILNETARVTFHDGPEAKAERALVNRNLANLLTPPAGSVHSLQVSAEHYRWLAAHIPTEKQLEEIGWRTK